MKYAKSVFLMALLIPLNLGVNAASAQAGRWTEQKANDWYGRQPWLVGSNYIPKSAINQLEMWQKETFDPPEIDKEMGWAEAMGMNTMRVFLHDLLWERETPLAFKTALNDHILAWDVWNEPGSGNARAYPKDEIKDKTARVSALLPQVFEWARSANPMQPLTSGVWAVDTNPDGSNLGELQQIQLRESDIVTFHNYTWPEYWNTSSDRSAG